MLSGRLLMLMLGVGILWHRRAMALPTRRRRFRGRVVRLCGLRVLRLRCGLWWHLMVRLSWRGSIARQLLASIKALGARPSVCYVPRDGRIGARWLPCRWEIIASHALLAIGL